MASRLFFVLLGLVLSAIQEEESVWLLNDKNIQEALRKQPEILVHFYTPDCTYCQKLSRPFSQAAKRLKDQAPPIRIGKVDASKSPGLADKYKIQNFPSFRYITKDNMEDFTGSRSDDGFTSWVLKKNNKPFTILSDLSSLKSRLEKSKVSVVYFGELDTNEYRVFTVVSKTVDDPSFFICTDAKARSHYQVISPALIMFKQFDDRRVDYEGNFITSEVVEFIEKNKNPLIIEFNEVVDDFIYIKKKVCLLLLRHNAESKEYDKMLKRLSKQLEGKLVVSYLDISVEEFRSIAANFGVLGKKQPLALILDPANDLRYLYEGLVNEENLKQFLKDWKQKKLQPLVRSQDLPEKDVENFVKVLVVKNFQETVANREKDVLVLFYVPGSEEFQRFKMRYERLGKMFKDNEDLQICKIDMTLNEIRGMRFENYPTIIFYTMNNKKGIKYEEDLDEGKLKEFIEKNAKSVKKNSEL